MHLKKGDNVIIVTGKDRGKTGKIVKSLPKENKVIVEGLNLAKRHQKPRKQGAKGQIVSVAMPTHVSNVMMLDQKTGKPTRVGYKTAGDKKIRVAKKSGSEI